MQNAKSKAIHAKIGQVGAAYRVAKRRDERGGNGKEYLSKLAEKHENVRPSLKSIKRNLYK
jgi:hypothetical protein